MSTNLFSAFRRLLPASPRLKGEVISSGAGAVVVELPGGDRLTVLGEAAPGDHVFVRNGAVEGPAPAFTSITLEV